MQINTTDRGTLPYTVKPQGGNFTQNNEFNSYFFRWLSATMPEEEIYNNLIALDNGEVDVKTLIKRYNVRNVTPN